MKLGQLRDRGHRIYGAGPLHLLSLLAGFAFAGYVVTRVLQVRPESIRILIWFAGAAVVHDLMLWPLYALADRVATTAHRSPRVPWVNYVRVPVVLSAVMLIISWPLVLDRSEPAYHAASGLTESVYLGRFLLLSGTAFAISAVLYGIRLVRSLTRRP